MRHPTFLAAAAAALLLAGCNSFPPVDSASTPQTSTSGAKPPATPLPPYDFARFEGIEQSVQGGVIVRVAYSERPGDASYSLLSVEGGALMVKGQFSDKGQSAWAGVGVRVDAPVVALDARAYKSLRVRLSAAPGVDKLRVRLAGTDEQVLQSGCYPVTFQDVSPEPKDYDIAFSRFAPESFCGPRGIPVSATLSGLGGVEIVDAVSPVSPRAVQFSVGNIELTD